MSALPEAATTRVGARGGVAAACHSKLGAETQKLLSLKGFKACIYAGTDHSRRDCEVWV